MHKVRIWDDGGIVLFEEVNESGAVLECKATNWYCAEGHVTKTTQLDQKGSLGRVIKKTLTTPKGRTLYFELKPVGMSF